MLHVLKSQGVRKSGLTASGNDSDDAFMLVEIDGEDMYFQAISDKAVTLDAGHIRRAEATTVSKER